MPKNVLFIVPYAPNLIRVRPYNLIRYLSQRGNRVTVLTLWSDEMERASIEALKPDVHRIVAVRLPRWRSMLNCLAALPSNKPLQSVYCWEPALARQIDALTQSANGQCPVDVVHVEHLRGAHYGLYLKSSFASRNIPLPVVWDSVDSISLLFRQAMVRSKSVFSRNLTRFELGRTERYEGWLLDQFDRVLVTSPADQQALLSLRPSGHATPQVSVLRNGVDLDYFKPDPAVAREPASLIVSGKMSYHANITMVLNFVQEIMPRVWSQRPDARLVVVGKDPPREILSLTGNPNIEVTGTVAHLPPYLQKATLAVAPLAYGAGIQNKVLEAMACSTPVVATPQAVSALDVQPGTDVEVAGDPSAFASAILCLLNDPSRRNQIGEAGRAYVQTHHHWATVAARLEEIYTEVST